MEILSPDQVKEKIEKGALLVDVRTPEETKDGYIKGALLIDSREFAERTDELGSDAEREIVVYCRSGHRSGNVAAFLIERGFPNVFNGGGYKDLVEVLPST